MPDFMDEAKDLADKDPNLADKGLDEAGQAAEGKTGGRFDSQIEDGEAKGERWLGTDS